MELFKQLRTISIANAVITLLSGLLLCLWPENANSLIVTLICIFIIFNGIINLLEFFLELRYHSLNKGGLLIAVLKILFGIYLFTHKNILSAFLGIFFSVYIVMEGCNGIEEAYRLFRYKVRGSLISLILSIIIMVSGIVFLFNPLSAAETMMVYIGITLIIDGISRIISIFAVQKAGKEVWDILYNPEHDAIDEDYREL